MKKWILFFISAFFFLAGYAQSRTFTAASIPLVQGDVVFTVNFKSGLKQAEFHKIAYRYLKDGLKPYSGIFLEDNDANTVCLATDYLSMVNGVLQSFGMYMTYRLELSYANGLCILVIKDISYMEKNAFEANEKARPRTTIPKWSGKDIMVDHKYHLLLIGNISKRITDASLDRINEIVKSLDAAFVKQRDLFGFE